MSTTLSLVATLKAELKAAGVTYADLVVPLGMSESSIKRSFAKGDMPLSRIDEVLRVLKMDFSELARKVVDVTAPRRELTLEQEQAVVADKRLLLLALSCLSHWTFEQFFATYRYSEAECVGYLTTLDRLGFIELKPNNRYRLLVDKTFRWRPNGPVMSFFRHHVADDFFDGGFDGEGETMMLVHGRVAPARAADFVERLQRVGQDFAQQHIADQRLPNDQREAFAMVIGMRNWWFSAFKDLRREREVAIEA